MNTAFFAVFGVFVALMVGVGFFAIRWALRRDRAVRASRREEPGSAEPGGPKP